jgi:hypothetical protein
MTYQEATMSKTRALVTILGFSLMILLAAGLLVTSANAQTGGAANQIVIRSQETNTGQIVVDTVIAAQAGWLVVYSDTTFSAASALGWAPVNKGVNANLKINIDGEAVESLPVLWAVLHIDREVIGQLELPLIDAAVYENGRMVMVAFGTQAAPIETAAPALQPAPAAVGAPTLSTSVAQPQTLPPAGARLATPWLWLAMAGGAACAAGVTLRMRRSRA